MEQGLRKLGGVNHRDGGCVVDGGNKLGLGVRFENVIKCHVASGEKRPIQEHTERSSEQHRTTFQRLVHAVGSLLSLRSSEEEADGQGEFAKHFVRSREEIV